MDDETQGVWELIQRLDYCMFVTATDNRMRARPMSTIVNVDQRSLHVLADRRAKIDDEIGANRNVLLTFSDGASTFVSLQGAAEVTDDVALIEQLWNPGAQAFWPEGPRGGHAVAITVTPLVAETWIGPGKLVGAVKFAFALATGTRPDLGSKRTHQVLRS